MQAIARLFNSLFGRRNVTETVIRPATSRPRAASNRRSGVLVQGVEWQNDCLVLLYFQANQLVKTLVDLDRSSIELVMRATAHRVWDLQKLLIGKRVDLTFHDGRIAIHEPSTRGNGFSNRQVATFAPQMGKAIAGRIDVVNTQHRFAEGNDTLVRALAVFIDQQMYWVDIENSELPLVAGADLYSEEYRHLLKRALAGKHIIGFITDAKPDEFGFRTITLHRWSDANACRRLVTIAKRLKTAN